MNRNPSDFRASLTKQECRQWNLEGLQGSHGFLTHRGKTLLRDWVELAGEGAPTLELLKPWLGGPADAKFIGIDRNPAVLQRCQEKYKDHPHADWVPATSLQSALQYQRERFKNVGVINFDTTDGLQSSMESLEIRFKPVLEFVQETLPRAREMLLIINMVGRGIGVQECVRTYEDLLQPLLQLTERKLEEGDFLRYHSTRRGTPMVNVRVRLGY